MGDFTNPLGLGDEDLPGGEPTLPPTVDALVQGDSWKPKNRSTLGFLADVLLSSFGGRPVFGPMKKQENIRQAMESFNSDPMEAIRRMNMIKGQQGEAWKMYGQYRDDIRADAAQTRLMGKDDDSRLKSISGLAGVALANPNNRQAAIAQYNARLQKWGLDDYLLPDDVSDAELQSIYMGVAPADKQERINYQKGRLQQIDRGLDIREEQGDRRLDQNDRRLDFEEVKEKGRNDRAAKSASTSGVKGKAFKDSNGNLVEFDPKDENKLKVTNKDGSVYMFKKDLNGRPILIKTYSAEEYAAALAEAKKK